jgi:hypothetical protein
LKQTQLRPKSRGLEVLNTIIPFVRFAAYIFPL